MRRVLLKLSAADKCELLAEITVAAVKDGAMKVCESSKNPAVCAVAKLLKKSTAATKLAEKFTEDGCDWVVEKVGDKFRFKAVGEKSKVEDAKKEVDKAKKIDTKIKKK
jgi:hypothetical protein